MAPPCDFSACRLQPVHSDTETCFYQDASGRARLSVALQLIFPSAQDREACRDCIVPAPLVNNNNNDNDSNNNNDHDDEHPNEKESNNQARIGVQAKVALTYGTGQQAVVTTVEQVQIRSTQWSGDAAVVLETQVTLRVVSSNNSTTTNKSDTTAAVNIINEPDNVKANLELMAVWREPRPDLDSTQTALATLCDLHLLGGHGKSNNTARSVNVVAKTQACTLRTVLKHAMTLHATSVPGPILGQTYLSLTVRHAGTHAEPLLITRVCLHPASSSPQEQSPKDTTTTTTDTPVVQWGYAPRSDPQLPLGLECHQAISMVLLVQASAPFGGSFSCPVSVTALLGPKTKTEPSTQPNDDPSLFRYQVRASTDVSWTAGTQVSTTPSRDRFHVELHIPGSTDTDSGSGSSGGTSTGTLDASPVLLGAPFGVHVTVRNLGTDTKQNVMVRVAPEQDEPDPEPTTTLRVQGLTATTPASGTFTTSNNHDLISLDGACLLGPMEGNATAQALLRFIPLREGLVSIPPLQLVDDTTSSLCCYACPHQLRAVVVGSNGP